jgi:hypothetical protein
MLAAAETAAAAAAGEVVLGLAPWQCLEVRFGFWLVGKINSRGGSSRGGNGKCDGMAVSGGEVLSQGLGLGLVSNVNSSSSSR